MRAASLEVRAALVLRERVGEMLDLATPASGPSSSAPVFAKPAEADGNRTHRPLAAGRRF